MCRPGCPTNLDYWLLHIDSTGAILWENTYGGPHRQTPTALCRGIDGSLWLGGETALEMAGGQIDIVYGSTDCWVVHTDSLGQFLGQRVLGANQEDALSMLHPLPDGSVLAGGRYYTNAGDRSPGFPLVAEGSEGAGDIFLAHLSPNTVGISNKDVAAIDWVMYPNPAGREVTLQPAIPGVYEVTITTITGKWIYTGAFRDKLTLNTAPWPRGLYLVHCKGKQGAGSRKLLLS